ncbi:HDOD domain-containing protein [Desulfolutivibrio sulfoxidireducens]|uniref:HDOD domain-containing protein n=1 Tax=Desulfolutivibrio sulfoxidireducens TaxID=2773299 RepID=UPI00159D38ED|nr:HDOD domain-containing protein [Desulfolutivibrio sulfoxidireducens]QLA16406.1 HDOD domain-containing protein [Desulfolutivibrio sulfoxidireducens]QLA19713.1 HDOD domain-containing protein [Desulfolutivibrio sulfoxidireducens]
MNRRDEIISKALAVPQMPMPVQKVMSILNDPGATMTQLARLIEYEPGLTVNILRMANSAFFGGHGAVSTVKDAIMRLGMQRVFQMVLASGVIPFAKYEIKGYGLPPGQLLEHSAAVAVASERLAVELGITAPPHTFTSGLLVNIGKVVLGAFVEVDADPILELAYSRDIPFEQAERAVLGIDHAEIGAMILEHWNLPAPIVLVVRHRFDPESAPARDVALDLVHVGDVVAKMSGIGLGFDGMHYAPSETVFTRLGLTPEHLERALEDAIEHFFEIRDILAEAG